MSISTKLSSEQMLARFTQISEEIQLRQTKVSTGREITEAAEKPLEAVKLSALEEGLTQLRGFEKNVEVAQSRLSLGDTVLQSADERFARLVQIAVSANSDVQAGVDKAALRIEVSQIREALVDLANTKTSGGQALFGGYSTDITPFSEDSNGRVQYRGDGGLHTMATSETMRLPTSINGGMAFMNVETADGIESIFDIIDSFEAAIATESSTVKTLSNTQGNGLSLNFNGDRTPRDWSFTLQGPSGLSPIITVLEVVGGSNTRLIEAINEYTSDTGVIASEGENGELDLDEVGGLTPAGGIELSNLNIEGVTLASNPPQFTITDGDRKPMVPVAQSLNVHIDKIKEAGENIAISRTTVGARLQRANDQETLLQTRSLALEVDVNELGSADLTKLAVEIKALTLMSDAAMLTYSRISQGSLFDFIK